MGGQDAHPSTQDAQDATEVAEATMPQIVIAPAVKSGRLIDELRQHLPREVMVEVIERVEMEERIEGEIPGSLEIEEVCERPAEAIEGIVAVAEAEAEAVTEADDLAIPQPMEESGPTVEADEIHEYEVRSGDAAAEPCRLMAAVPSDDVTHETINEKVNETASEVVEFVPDIPSSIEIDWHEAAPVSIEVESSAPMDEVTIAVDEPIIEAVVAAGEPIIDEPVVDESIADETVAGCHEDEAHEAIVVVELQETAPAIAEDAALNRSVEMVSDDGPCIEASTEMADDAVARPIMFVEVREPAHERFFVENLILPPDRVVESALPDVHGAPRRGLASVRGVFDALGRLIQHPVTIILAGIAGGLVLLWWLLGE